MSVTWNYNATTTLAVSIVATAGEWYEFRCDQDFNGPGRYIVQADGSGAASATFSGIVDPASVDDDPGSPNHSFGVQVIHVSDAFASSFIAWFACNVFYFGESSTTGHKLYAVWSYDGAQAVSVDLPTFSGMHYRINYTEFVGGGGNSNSSAVHGGTGLVQTISVTLDFVPDPVNGYAEVTMSDPGSAFPNEEWTVTNRMFAGGTAAVTLGNPEPPTTIQLVAVGDNPGATSRIQLSNEGIVWTLAADPDPTGTLFGVAIGNGTLIACGDAGVARSTDSGATWTAHTTPLNTSGGNNFGVCYSADLTMWVIGGFASTGDESVIVTSTDDGVTWTEQTTPWQASTDGAFVNAVAWAAGQFVAVGTSKSAAIPFPVVMTSPDGTTWTSQSTPMDGGSGVLGVWYDSVSSLWVGDGSNGHTIITSPDAVTWTSRFTAGVGASGARSPATNLATASATWAAGSAVATSPDGVTWTTQTTPFSVSGANGTDWAQTLFTFPVAAVTTSGMFLSSDGVGWFGGFSAPGGFTPQDVCAIGNVTPPVVRCKNCGSGLLGTLLRL